MEEKKRTLFSECGQPKIEGACRYVRSIADRSAAWWVNDERSLPSHAAAADLLQERIDTHCVRHGSCPSLQRPRSAGKRPFFCRFSFCKKKEKRVCPLLFKPLSPLAVVVASFVSFAPIASERAHSLRCSSSPHKTRFAGLLRGPRKEENAFLRISFT